MMPWRSSEDEFPIVEIGTRIIVIISERENVNEPIKERIVALEYAENGWSADDETYGGYAPDDGLLWAYEADLLKLAMPTIEDAPCGVCGRQMGRHSAEDFDACAEKA